MTVTDDQEAGTDLAEVLHSLTNLVINERIRCYNEGFDAGRAQNAQQERPGNYDAQKAASESMFNRPANAQIRTSQQDNGPGARSMRKGRDVAPAAEDAQVSAALKDDIITAAFNVIGEYSRDGHTDEYRRMVVARMVDAIFVMLPIPPADAQVRPTPPTSLHYLGDGPEGGCAKTKYGFVAYFATETQCQAFMAFVGSIPPELKR